MILATKLILIIILVLVLDSIRKYDIATSTKLYIIYDIDNDNNLIIKIN